MHYKNGIQLFFACVRRLVPGFGWYFQCQKVCDIFLKGGILGSKLEQGNSIKQGRGPNNNFSFLAQPKHVDNEATATQVAHTRLLWMQVGPKHTRNSFSTPSATICHPWAPLPMQVHLRCITAQCRQALREHGLTSILGVDASHQPGNLQELLLLKSCPAAMLLTTS